MRKEQGDVEPRDKIEEKESGDKRVLSPDEIKHEQPNAGNRLPETEPVRTQQFVLQKIIFRAGQCFQNHSDDKHAAVGAVALPGQDGARRIKGDNEPYTD